MEKTRKIALVTGGSRGLGRNSAIALSRKGFDVIVTYHSRKEEAEFVVKEIEANGQKAAALQLDAGDVSGFELFVSRIAAQGRIINVSTGLTRFTLEGYGAYAAMKGAIEILTKYMAKEWGKRGIRVNTIAPGAIATDFQGGAVRDNQGLNDFIGSQTALGRVGEADDIGGLVASMCTDEMGWVNAQRIEASGGMFL